MRPEIYIRNRKLWFYDKFTCERGAETADIAEYQIGHDISGAERLRVYCRFHVMNIFCSNILNIDRCEIVNNIEKYFNKLLR